MYCSTSANGSWAEAGVRCLVLKGMSVTSDEDGLGTVGSVDVEVIRTAVIDREMEFGWFDVEMM